MKTYQFRIGRGGRFNNKGYIYFEGEESRHIEELVSFYVKLDLDSYDVDDMERQKIYDFFNEAIPTLIDGGTLEYPKNPSIVATIDDVHVDYDGVDIGTYEECYLEDGTKNYNIDEDYHTVYTCYLKDFGTDEWAAVKRDNYYCKEEVVKEYLETINNDLKKIGLDADNAFDIIEGLGRINDFIECLENENDELFIFEALEAIDDNAYDKLSDDEQDDYIEVNNKYYK